MKKKLLCIVSMIPLIVTAVILPKFPEKLPMHYDIDGNIDRWGSKYEQFIFPVMIIGIMLFWQLFLLYFSKKEKNAAEDKERQEAKANGFVIFLAALGMVILFSVMHFTFLYSAWTEAIHGSEKMTVDINQVVFTCMGVFLVIIGNFLPKAKRNSMLGLRTSWSMENDQTWAASQRMGGKILMLAGIFTLIAAFLLHGALLVVVGLGLIVLASILAAAYSYHVYQTSLKIDKKCK